MLHHPVGHYLKMLHNAPHRHHFLEIRKLYKTERYTEVQTDLLGHPLVIPDAHSFLPMYLSIFDQEVYKFVADNNTPYILDGGANIGMSALYFKKIYPDAAIVAFEPDPKIYAVLQRNIRSAALQNVELVNRALWNEETTLLFASEGSDAGRIANDGAIAKEMKEIEVQTVRLRDYLDRPIDFLKLDIEGAETTVIEDCHDRLQQVKRLFVEYHSFENQPQTIDRILTILKDNGFRVYIQSESATRQPFVKRALWEGMDMYANIFAYRD